MLGSSWPRGNLTLQTRNCRNDASTANVSHLSHCISLYSIAEALDPETSGPRLREYLLPNREGNQTPLTISLTIPLAAEIQPRNVTRPLCPGHRLGRKAASHKGMRLPVKSFYLHCNSTSRSKAIGCGSEPVRLGERLTGETNLATRVYGTP